MNWITKFKHWQTTRILRKHAIPNQLWIETTASLPLINVLNLNEKERIRELATLFIYEKSFSGAHDFVVTGEMQVVIAAQACLEIMHLGLSAFDGWKEIIIYPGAFRVTRNTHDEMGLVTTQDNVLSGEAWGLGPVILSWDNVAQDSFHSHTGHNVVIHEFAHKLDMLNGRANGMPPLHPDMHIEEWTHSLSQAYIKLTQRVEHHHAKINAYAITNPAEFFAVICEYYFTAPDILLNRYPEVYHQLKRYFRQDPIERFTAP